MAVLARASLPILVLLLAGVPHFATAQTLAPPAGDTSGFAPLPLEKQERIRAFVRAQETPATPAATTADVPPGATLPPSVPLRGLPRDMVTEISKVTSYRYVVLDKTIAIVEPDTRRVVQVISR